MRILQVVIGFAIGCLCGSAMAEEPTTAALLQIETGMHTAKITSVATDAKGQWAVTTSDDKTARIWSVSTGLPEGALRVPQDLGDEGKLYSAAMSPDGASVAVAGITGWRWGGSASIYIFDRATLSVQRRITGLPGAVFRLAYSADGRWLAAALDRKNGVRVFDSESGSQVGADTNYEGSSYSVEFSPVVDPDGTQKLLSTGWDGIIRLYGVNSSGGLNLLGSQPSGGARPYVAKFSSDGLRFAVGFDDARVVKVFDAQNFAILKTLDIGQSTNARLQVLAWSSDGKQLAAAGEIDGGHSTPVYFWSTHDWSLLTSELVSGGSITDLVSLPSNGGWLFSSQDPAWGFVNRQMALSYTKSGYLALDFRGRNDQLLVSKSGEQILFPYFKEGAGHFDLSRRELVGREKKAQDGLTAARLEASGLEVRDWNGKLAPTLNAQSIKLDPDERALSLAIAPNGLAFGLGTEWWLRLFDRSGTILWSKPVPGHLWALNISLDGRWVVAGYGDGTIRWHRIEDGREVLAFFPHADRKRWVLWTPEGFYDASPADSDTPSGEDLIGYHVNRGKDREGEFISAAQLRDGFYNPALVTARLTPDGDRLMAAAVKRLGNVTALLENARNLPPLVEVIGESDTVKGKEEVEVTFRLTDRGGGVGTVRFYVNGRPVEGRHTGLAKGATSTHKFPLASSPTGLADGTTFTRKFPLTPGIHTIRATATSRGGVESTLTAPLTAIISGPKRAGTLHILAVGVETYQDPKLRLQNSVADAERLAAEIARRAKPIFPQRVAKPVVLKNEQATLAGIRAAFDTMSRRFDLSVDTLVIFLAGHGDAAIGQYTYLPWDFKRGAPGVVGAGLNEALLLDMLQRSPENTLLLLDTCDAGGMVEMLKKSYLRLGQRAFIGASRHGELAREGYKGHGVFTAGLLQVLGTKTGEPVTPMELYPQVERAVERISTEMGGGYLQRVSGHTPNAKFPVVQR